MGNIEASASNTTNFSAVTDIITKEINKSGVHDTVKMDLNEFLYFKDWNNLKCYFSNVEKILDEYQKQVQIINFDVHDSLSNIGQDRIDDIISFESTIKMIPNNPEPLLIGSVVDCYCKKNIVINENFFSNQKIPFCTVCGKQMIRSLNDNNYTDMKIITVEEPPEEFINSNSQPRTLKCLLKGDMARNKPPLNPGDRVKIIGKLKIKEFKINRKRKETYILDVLGIENIDENFHNIPVSNDEKNEFENLNKKHDMFELLSKNILPDFIGHEYVKKAILCQLFSQTTGNKRGNIHILLVGDPGLNKSQILLRIQKLVPKSAYCVGGSLTVGGLTGIVNRDEFTGQWTAEAGLLPKCHKGLLCIDEVDKIHRESLGKFNEALEQQQTTITKANLNVTYPAETTVLCAMNPKKGHFDMYEDVNSQINIPDSFMDRFDLIFLMQDLVDQKNDILILDSLLNKKKRNNLLTDEIILKYISYAKKEFPDPHIDKEAKKVISKYYQKIRSNPDPLRIHNARDIEALSRLSKSIARIYLRNIVKANDVKIAIDIYESSLSSFILKERVGQNLETFEMY